MTSLITLNANGFLLIQTMRKSLAYSQEAWMPDRSAAVYKKIEKNFRQLIELLIQVDPYIVKLRPLFDTKLTLFELQFLCVILAGYKGEEETVRSILNWWFPQNYITEAKYILRVIVDILEKTGLKLQLPESLKEKILVADIPLSKQPDPFVCIDFQPNTTSEHLRFETVH
jgi:hypothetical protein